jgi:hypothetical protein
MLRRENDRDEFLSVRHEVAVVDADDFVVETTTTTTTTTTKPQKWRL